MSITRKHGRLQISGDEPAPKRRRLEEKVYVEHHDNFWKNRNNASLPVFDDKLYIMLDSYTLNSSKFQISQGVPPKNIHIVEKNWRTFKRMQKNNTIGVNLHYGNISNCISWIKGPIGVLYFDFMGNVADLPDFHMSLEKCRDQICKEAVIGLTFSARFRKKNASCKKLVRGLQKKFSELLPDRSIDLDRHIGYRRSEDEKVYDSCQTMMFIKFVIDSPIPIFTEFRPLKFRRTNVKGSDILRKLRRPPSHIEADKFYDEVIWWLYPKKEDWSWELHGSIIL